MRIFGILLATGVLGASMAHAGPGDLHEVTADLVNLRGSPSDNGEIRDRLEGGTEVIELRRDGGWYGIRVVETGQEGWVYGDLLRRMRTSGLDGASEGPGFESYSEGFERLVSQINERLGVSMVRNVAEDGDVLTVTPTEGWLRRSGLEAQLLAAAAIWQMWKNHRGDAPVRVVLLNNAGEDYVVVDDEGESGPRLSVIEEASGREG